MPTLDSISLDYLFTLLKGEPGTRKSTCALSYPTPQYWISTDQKMEALTLPAKRWGVNMKDIHYDDYTDWDKQKAKLEQLQVSCPYKTLIVDSITSDGDVINRQTLKSKRGTKRTDGSDKGLMIGNIPVNSIEDYKAEASAFQELIALLKDIHKFHKIHVILIAHVVGQRKADENNQLTHHSRVIVTGGDKISAKIPAYCSEVYHFNVKSDFNVDSGEGKYGLFTVHTGNDFARTSLPLERRIEFNNEPLYNRWIKPGIEKLKTEQPIQQITTPVSVKTF